MNEQQLIDEITMIRAKNNLCWMQILTIALKHAPNEARTELRAINNNDLAIAGLLQQIAELKS